MNSKQFLTIVAAVAIVYVGTVIGNYFTAKLAVADQGMWSEVCVRGQSVYTIVLANHALAINALNDDGKPIKCQIESS